MSQTIIGIMGPGDQATAKDCENAYELGKLIAQQGWILLTGGRKAGVMEAALQGAKASQGLTVGVLPTADKQGMSEAVDIAIVTDLGNARNNINVLSSNLVVACGMGLGTASEVALALKNGKQVILVTECEATQAFFRHLSPQNVKLAANAPIAFSLIQEYLTGA